MLWTLKVHGDDSFAPCWRGNSGTTYQNWSFSTSNNPASPELVSNPFGSPQATLAPGSFSTGWKSSTFGGKTGVWDLGKGGQATVVIPGAAGGSSSWEYVQVQATYFQDSLAYAAPNIALAGATLVSSQTTNNVVGLGTWKTVQQLWLLQPATASQTVIITGSNPSRGLLLDQVVVDTRAPGTADLVPAYRPCWRGLSGSTFAQWSFGISNNPASLAAELVTNAFGTPTASISPGAFSDGYIEEDSFFGCVQGIWDLGQNGSMTFNIPNTTSGSVGAYKYVQVQVAQFRDTSIYTSNAVVSISGGTRVSKQEQVVSTNSYGGQWVMEKTIWRLGPPSPASETIVVTGGIYGALIDQVTVDTLMVDFSSPSDLTFNADAGQCSKSNVTWTVPTIDGCVVTNVVNTPANGSTFAVGTNSVSYVVKDSLGGTRSFSFEVIVRDVQAPTIICPANITVAALAGQCGAVVNFTPVASDNCSGATVTSTPASGSLFPLGLTTVTSVAHDAAGNSSSPCTFTVRVVDYSGDVAANRPCWRGLSGTTFAQWAFSVSNSTANVSPELATNSYGTPSGNISLGAFSEGYIEADPFFGCVQGIWDLGQFGSMTFNVPNAPSGSTNSYKYVLVQVTQFRDASIYPTNALVSISGGVRVSRSERVVGTNSYGDQWVDELSVWKLGSPNPTSESVVITGGVFGALIDQVAIDTTTLDFATPPDIALNADAGLCTKSNVTWTLPVVDGCRVTNVVSTPPSGSTFAVGTNAVSYVVRDGQGGTDVFNFNVIITDTQPPIALCKNASVNLDAFGNASITASDINNGSSDNCGIASLLVTPNTFTCANVGSNAVTLLVTDIHGLTASCSAAVFVHDTILPTISAPVNVTVNSDAGQCYASGVNLGTPVTADNCGVASVVNNAPAHFPLGNTTVTWTVTDSAGNTATATQHVSVADHEAPVVVAGTIAANYVSTTTAEAAAIAATTASDNCGTPTKTASTIGTCSAVITVTATDAAGNSNFVTYNTSIDGTAPTIGTVNATESAIDVKDCANTALQGTVNISVVASDNCGLAGVPAVTMINGLSTDAATFVSESPTGTFNYTWNVTATTANGTWNVTVGASDLGQTTTSSFTLCVNKSQIAGQVQLEQFDGSGTIPPNTRDVTFVVSTNWVDGDGVTNTITLLTNTVTLAFVGDTANYTLTGLPPNVNGISAKTAWNLRSKLFVTLDGNQQAVDVNFTGDKLLLGGDLADENTVDLISFFQFAYDYQTDAAESDINGDGIVDILDYFILGNNYQKVGDSQ